MKMKGYTLSNGRFCQVVTSGMIFSLIFVTSSGEISTSYSSLICSAMSRWLIPQAYSARILVCVSTVFADDLRLKSAVSIPGNLDIYLAQLCLHGFLCVAITIVPGCALRLT